MNDFTKKELYLLSQAMNALYSNLNVNDSDLYKKIQSMINNYDAKIVEAWHCEKCGHVQ